MSKIRPLALALLLFTLPESSTPLRAQTAPKRPAVGEKAPEFTLAALDGARVTLSAELKQGPVVLVLLRGWPGYQCPFCVRQFGEFLGRKADLAAAGARVLWIYPT